MADTYEINFSGGSWTPEDAPKQAGVYAIYRCRKGTPNYYIDELLYVGQAKDLNQRVPDHKEEARFKNSLNSGDLLYYTWALVDGRNLDIVENALIFMQTPPLNDKQKDSYNHSTPVSFTISGNYSYSIWKMKSFTIN